jgi:hypothetical protein
MNSTLLGLALLLSSAAAPADAPADPPAPEGQVVLFKLQAKGWQVYECKVINPDARALRFHWVLTGPDAVLTDGKGGKAGKHYAGPTWESDDGSKVVAELPPVESTPQTGAVPWLLLKAKANEGAGQFKPVTYIRRVDTVGGVAPADPDPAYLGTELRVPYKATYIFYGAKP